MKSEPNQILAQTISGVVMMLSGVIGIYIVLQLTGNTNTSHNGTPTTTPPIVVPSEYPDFDAIKGPNPVADIKVLKLTDLCQNTQCTNDNPASKDLDGIDTQIQAKGEFSRAYLYTELAVDYTRPLTSWDDFLFCYGRPWRSPGS